ncbi:MAG: aminotransferase class I/II-fold pyridoxal phosphate-dependent enzyme [Sediminibacterium sp.]|nr:aminotransferase class I/II-fold pyridoxal phosphate-dependent enzyme [Sediminibacterium sp.]
MIDLRSDTVTKPTPAMILTMQEAAYNGVGDDVFKEDPTTNLLEKKLAEMFQMEDGLFCPSGTMTNQIAIKCHTQPGEEVICEETAHIYQNEVGGIAFHSNCSVKLIKGKYGIIHPTQIEDCINKKDDIHKPTTSLLCLENTSNRGGGTCYNIEHIQAMQLLCKKNGLAFHLDGARLFNALVAKNQHPQEVGILFDSISICLSKGLACPAGSVLLGNKLFIQKARKMRKLFGGGMRQVGILAAAGIYALDNHIQRLHIDHFNAQQVYECLQNLPFVAEIYPVETNIIIFSIKENSNYTANSLVQKLLEYNIQCFAISKNLIRFVLHLQITNEEVQFIINTLKKI